MNLHFTEEKLKMRKLVRDFASKYVTPDVKKMENGEFPRNIIKRLGERGFMGITVPKKYGGLELDFISYIIAINELSKISATIGVILSVHTSVGTNPILYYGNERQMQKYVPKLASGDYLGAFSLTEPEAGSDASNIKATAVKNGAEYILNGTKAFVTNGGEADVYITFAKTDAMAGSHGITAFIVEKDSPGLVIGKDERKMGLHGSRTTQLIFDNMRIPIENRLGQEGEGFGIALSNLNIGRIGIAAQALGIAEAAFEAATDWITERNNVTHPIIEQFTFKLTEMATAIESARLLVYQAADLWQRGIGCSMEVAMAKLFTSRIAVEVTINTLQMYGDHGYTTDYPIERYFRDAKITEIYEGTSEIQRMVISKELLK